MILNIPEKNMNDVYAPSILRLNDLGDRKTFENLVNSDAAIIVIDEIDGQLRELIKSNNPSIKIKPGQYPELIEKHLDGKDLQEYGAWVFFPWSNRLIHLLDEAEFVEVRTNRNRYKITREEQHLLGSKKIGIIGLSVGQSIALTLAMERTCGELRLADFDTVELSNLNRIRTGLHNLGLRKTVIAAREISEIDPYLRVKIFNDGLTSENIDAYFTENGNLDLLVEVCDGLDVKILSRFKARELRIPVVMDTNDRGMLDVERFDTEPGRPILHGLAGDLDPAKISGLTNEEKIPYILTMIGAETISSRLKASMLEVEQSINTWPQLASSVALGGAITTDVCRSIFLDQFHDSGRYYIDVGDIIKDRAGKASQDSEDRKVIVDGPPSLTLSQMEAIAKNYIPKDTGPTIDADQLQQVVTAASLAPSGGNAQPWKLLFQHNNLYIFHDAFYSFSLLDFHHLGSYIAFGAMLENIDLKSASLSLAAKTEVFPLKDDPRLIAVIHFEKTASAKILNYLTPVIESRLTNRNIATRKLLEPADAQALVSITATIPGAKLQLFDTEENLIVFDEILTNTERLRFLHPQGHYDTFVKELRFKKEEVASTADGLDVNTLNLKQSDIAALTVARDSTAISFLHQLHKGSGFKKISSKNILSASSIGVISMDGKDPYHFLQGGRALERVWLEANFRKLAFQPISQIIFMLELLQSEGGRHFNDYEMKELNKIRDTFAGIVGTDNGFPVFVFRLCYASTPDTRSLRRPLNEMFFVN
jgi:nitroreductase